MSDDRDIASLRNALAEAERARDEALAETAAIQQQRLDERREEQHRLRNLFSVIRAIVHRTADDVETVEDYCGVVDGRLAAYLRTQAALMQNWLRGADLALLLAEALRTFGLKEGERVDLVGSSIRLTSAAAGIAALIFHELAFRAVLSDRLGEPGRMVQVRWRMCGTGAKRDLLIDWMSAPPPPGEHAAPTSWVDWVEQAVRYQLSGTMTTETRTDGAGYVTQIRLPSSVTC